MNEQNKTHDAQDLVPMTNGKLVLALPEMEALAIQSLLVSNGINAVVSGTPSLPNLPFEIFVPAAQLQEATSIFLAAREAGAAAAEEAEAAGEAAGDAPPSE